VTCGWGTYRFGPTMIIFGWGAGKPRDMGAAVPFECGRCHNTGFARYMTVTRWLRLYFVPLLPYGTKHYLVCPICTASRELVIKAERDAAARLVTITAQMTSGVISESAYREQVAAELRGAAQLMLPGIVSVSSDPPPARPDLSSP
jgi:hypothetical protein